MRTRLTGGQVWCGPGRSDADALLIDDGIIVAVGSQQVAAAESADGAAEECIDLDGGFLMPSFGDGHAHPIFGGLEAAGPQVRACTSVEQIVSEVARYAAAHPEEEWIRGASYDGSLAADGLFDARWLDAAVGDRPVVLRAWDYHTVWCSSAALQAAGITAATPDPVIGEIPRRADGSVLGTLREWGAVDLLAAAMPPYSQDQRLAALLRAQSAYAAYGVTWVQDAWVEPDDVELYLRAASEDLLRLRFDLALYADPRSFSRQLESFVGQRTAIEQTGNELLRAPTIKFFADGVIENETAHLLEPYCSSPARRGMSVWPGAALAEAVAAVDRLGFQVHIHAIGDGAVRQALDAIEWTTAHNPRWERRPVIAHAQVIDPVDLRRFATLGVIANVQPYWAQLDELMNVLTVPRIGQSRVALQYPFRTLLETGAALAFGSDWPCSTADPRAGLAVALSRQTAAGSPPGGWLPNETVTVDAALAASTQGTAHQALADRRPHPWGRIARGCSADLVELAADPRTLSARALASVPIRATYVAGRRIFSA